MSSMIQGPPPSITIPGAGGAALPSPGGPPPLPHSANGPGDPDSATVSGLLKKALVLVDAAAKAENDPGDESSLRDIASKLQKAIANEQGLKDQVMGIGPGQKLVRKARGGV